MRKSLVSACLFASLTGGAFAAELQASDVAAVLSGKSYECENKDKDKLMKMVFPDLNPATQVIPYTYSIDGKDHDGAYVIKSNGQKMVSKGSNQKRRVVQTSATSVQIIGRSGQYWLCSET